MVNTKPIKMLHQKLEIQKLIEQLVMQMLETQSQLLFHAIGFWQAEEN